MVDIKETDLTLLAKKHGTDKSISKCLLTYEHYFGPIRKRNVKILEIGIKNGASHRMWRDYFEDANVFGIDNWSRSSRLDLKSIEGVTIFNGDQENREHLADFINSCGGSFDIIIDDGGHSMSQQQVSLGFLFSHIKSGGLYVIEDLGTSLETFRPGEPRWGRKKDLSNTTLTMITNFEQTKEIKSEYLLDSEKKYLTQHIKTHKIETMHDGNLFCFFRKR